LLVRHGPGSGEEVVKFEYRQLEADWAGLERLAKRSRARWILLSEEGTCEDLADFLPLFEDPRTFAVSRQSGLRHHKPRLLARAPFRQLQPGEACQVLAPVSSNILIDREKLLALGVPRVCYPGTAWLVLFWMAAAAGLRSYSVGPTRRDIPPLELLPDWPVQDSEFLIRMLENPLLKSLGPREPDLVQGNIAFRIGKTSLTGSRPRVLLVSPYLPYPLSHGGAVRIWNLCRELSDRVDFILASFVEAREQIEYGKLHEVFRKVYAVDRDEDELNDATLPAQVRQHGSRAMSALIKRLCRELQPDLLQIEYSHMAAFREAAPDVPAVLVAHDVTFTLYRQLAEMEGSRRAWREYHRWLAFERRWFRAYDSVWTMCEEDRIATLAQGGSPAGVSVIRNGVDCDGLAPAAACSPDPEILYVGSFRHLPNMIGFEELLEVVMPQVWTRFPGAKLVVVAGAEPEKYWRQFHKGKPLPRFGPRVQLYAFTRDLRPLYGRARVVAAPLAVSAGTNIKILEGMAAGKAIVATPVAVAGLGLRDGVEVLIRTSGPEFADGLIACLGNPALRNRIGTAARRTAELRYSWREFADHAYENYVSLLGESITTLKRASGVKP
jgi:glycosyltransferase involved in cell wall biosynthesis